MREKCVQDAADPDMRIVQAGGVDCGFFCLKLRPEELFINSLFLLPHYQRRGIGRQLLSRVHATSNTARLPVRLWVMHFNPDARVYYEAQGYVVSSEEAQWHCMERQPQPMPVDAALGHGGRRDCEFPSGAKPTITSSLASDVSGSRGERSNGATDEARRFDDVRRLNTELSHSTSTSRATAVFIACHLMVQNTHDCSTVSRERSPALILGAYLPMSRRRVCPPLYPETDRQAQLHA